MSDRVMRYAGAVALTLVAVVVAIVLERQLDVPDGLVFAASVAVCARYLGTGPGLMAAALSVVAIDATLLPPVGVLEFRHPEELAYLVVFTMLALVISGATHSLRTARARAVDLASRMSRLLDVSKALAEAELPADVAHVVMDRGLGVVDASVGLIGVVSGDQFHVLEWRASRAVNDATPPKIDLNGEGPLALAMRTRQPVWVASQDVPRQRFPKAYDQLRERGAQAFMALPLRHGDLLVGGLLLGFDETDSFGEEAQAFAHLLGQSASSAMARACTLERERGGRHEAEMLASTREQVLNIVAHDLRNPLGVAGSVMQLLSEVDLPREERVKLLESGSRAVQQMGRLISDLLDVIRMEAGRLTLELEDLPVSKVLNHAEDSVRHVAQEKQITLTVAEPDPNLYVRADRGRLAQVLGNLLGNAIKFTPNGGRVNLEARRDGSDVVFQVSDTGPGVSEENQSHMFDRFWQARASDRRGVGLGLAISRAIVEAHGGRIWVISTLGHGSSFFFTIPAGTPATATARAS